MKNLEIVFEKYDLTNNQKELASKLDNLFLKVIKIFFY